MKLLNFVLTFTILVTFGCAPARDSFELKSLAHDGRFVSEENYEEAFEGEIAPFWESGEVGFFTGMEGAQLFYRILRHPDPKANVILVHGFHESQLKLREVAYELSRQGYSIFLYDHRGHGFSDRLARDETVVHVERFDYYEEDMHKFISSVVQDDSTPLLILAHSMGGVITAGFLERHPGIIDAAILSSPLFDMVTDPIPSFVARGVTSMSSLFGFGERRALGEKKAIADEWTLASYQNTTSQVRFDRFKRDTLQQGIYIQGASNNWVKEAFRYLDRIKRPEEIEKIEDAVLLFQAGLDEYVRPKAQERFCSLTPRCRLISVEQAMHAIYFEADLVRLPYMLEVSRFFERHSNRDGSVSVGL